MRWFRPRSKMTTDRPAAVSSCAAVAPPGPDPTMMMSKSRLTAGSPLRLCSPSAARRRASRCSATPRVPDFLRTRALRTFPRTHARTETRANAPLSFSRRSCSAGSTSQKSSPSALSPLRYCSCSPTTGPRRSRSGRPREPSILVRQASSSLAFNLQKVLNRASPPKRPENGPPAQMSGGSLSNAPRKPSMKSTTAASVAPGCSSVGIRRAHAALTIAYCSSSKKRAMPDCTAPRSRAPLWRSTVPDEPIASCVTRAVRECCPGATQDRHRGGASKRVSPMHSESGRARCRRSWRDRGFGTMPGGAD